MLAAVEEFRRARERLDYLNRSGANDAEISRADDAWAEAIRAVTDAPATTPEGIRAKAAALRTVLERDVPTRIGEVVEDCASRRELLAYSLARDILGSAPT